MLKSRITRILRSKQGQIRAIDFMVSAFIFLIMLAQFVLLLFNIQVALHTTVLGDLNQSDASDLYRQIVLQPGSPNWGTRPELPQAFGLALEGELQAVSMSRVVLDPAKLARIGGDPGGIRSYLEYQPVTYQYIHDTIGLSANTHFQLRILPPLNVTYQQVARTNDNSLKYDVEVTYTLTRKPVSNASITFLVIDFLTGNVAELHGSSDSDGKASFTVIPPSTRGDQGFGLVIVARKSSTLWGINWVQDQNLTPAPINVITDADARRFESFISHSAQKNNYVLASSFIGLSQINNQTVLLLEEQTSGSFKVLTTSSSSNTDPITIESKASRLKGISILIHYVKVSQSPQSVVYYYRIMTLPAILDKKDGANRFHPPLAPSLIPDNIRGRITIQRTALSRGLLLITELTYYQY